MGKFPNQAFNSTHGLALWVLLHLVIWIVLPLACNTCLPLDCVEAVMWGSEWQWGYHKHPPLSAWVPELLSVPFGDAGVYLASQLSIVLAGLGIWKAGRLLGLTAPQALFAVLLLDTVYFYQYISVEFNVNILQLPFWAWGWYFGLAAMERRQAGYWIGLGVCVALGALTKYIAVFLLIPLFAAWWRRGQLGAALRAPGLWLAGAVAVLLFLPHLLWMAGNDFITIQYALDRTGGEQSYWWHHLWNPFEFMLGQAGILALVLVLAFVCGRLGGRGEAPRGSLALATGAYVFIALLALATGIDPVTMWAAPFPLAIGIWAVPRFGIDRFPRIVLPVFAAMWLLFAGAYAVVYGLGPVIRDKPHRVNYPGEALAAAAEAAWHERYERPLAAAVADEWLGGMINHYGEDSASVQIRAKPERSPWLTDQTIRNDGGLVLWLKAHDAADGSARPLDKEFPGLRERFPDLRELDDLRVPWPRRTDGKVGRYGLAVIPPAEGAAREPRVFETANGRE